MSTYWGLKASQTPKETVIPGTSKWIANEIYKSSGLVSSHVEQFSYSVIADLEWLDNQMKSILSAQERGSIDEFDESLYFLGSPTKTFTKLPKLSELQQQGGQGQIQTQEQKDILQLQYKDENKENKENKNDNIELLPKKNSKRLNDKASNNTSKTNKTNKLTSRNLNIKESELNNNSISSPKSKKENSKLQDEIKMHELLVSSTPFTKNISLNILNNLSAHNDEEEEEEEAEDNNSSDTNITDLSFQALTANTRKSIAQKNRINQQQQQQQQQHEQKKNDQFNEKISDSINTINKVNSGDKFSNSNEINSKPYLSTPLVKDASGGNLNGESVNDEINTLFEKHMMSQASRLGDTMMKRDIVESRKDTKNVIEEDYNSSNNNNNNNKTDESDLAEENDDSIGDLDKNFSIDIGKLEKIEVSMIRLPLKSADAVSKHNTPTTKRSSITFTALPHREPLTLKSATRKSNRISIRGTDDNNDETKTKIQSHNKDENTLSKQNKISKNLDYNKENDFKSLLSPSSPVSSSEPTIKMRNYYTSNNHTTTNKSNDNIKKSVNINNNQNDNTNEDQKQQYRNQNQNQKLDDIKEDSSFKGIFGIADKDVSIKETDNCDLSSNFEKTINKTNLSTYNHSSQRNSLNEFEESPIKVKNKSTTNQSNDFFARLMAPTESSAAKSVNKASPGTSLKDKKQFAITPLRMRHNETISTSALRGVTSNPSIAQTRSKSISESVSVNTNSTNSTLSLSTYNSTAITSASVTPLDMKLNEGLPINEEENFTATTQLDRNLFEAQKNAEAASSSLRKSPTRKSKIPHMGLTSISLDKPNRDVSSKIQSPINSSTKSIERPMNNNKKTRSIVESSTMSKNSSITESKRDQRVISIRSNEIDSRIQLNLNNKRKIETAIKSSSSNLHDIENMKKYKRIQKVTKQTGTLVVSPLNKLKEKQAMGSFPNSKSISSDNLKLNNNYNRGRKEDTLNRNVISKGVNKTNRTGVTSITSNKKIPSSFIPAAFRKKSTLVVEKKQNILHSSSSNNNIRQEKDEMILPEIYSDDEQNNDDGNVLMEWGRSPNLKSELKKQQLFDADKLFGPVMPITIEDTFRNFKANKYKSRLSSVNYMGCDRLTQKEIDDYAKQRAMYSTNL